VRDKRLAVEVLTIDKVISMSDLLAVLEAHTDA
jgi:hypothetical protein